MCTIFRWKPCYIWFFRIHRRKEQHLLTQNSFCNTINVFWVYLKLNKCKCHTEPHPRLAGPWAEAIRNAHGTVCPLLKGQGRATGASRSPKHRLWWQTGHCSSSGHDKLYRLLPQCVYVIRVSSMSLQVCCILSQTIVKYAKDSRMVYYFLSEFEVQIDSGIRFELQTRIHKSVKNYKHGGYPRPTDREW